MIRSPRLLRAIGLVAVAMASVSLLSPSRVLAQVNLPVEVTAIPRDNPESNSADIEGWFSQVPNGNRDEIHVINDGVKGKDYGIYNDPTADGARLNWVRRAGPVIVSVEGREAAGKIYWVEVEPDNAGKGKGGKRPDDERPDLVADVGDLDVTLRLRDTVSGHELFDHTTTDADTGTLVCWPRAKTGFVEFQLLVSDGTFDWAISGDGIEYRGMLSATNSWTDSESELPPGRYQLVVSNGGIQRRIDFIVYGVRIDYVDANFAPSVERLTIKYSILPEGFSVDRAWLEISRSASKETLIFSDATIARSGTEVDYVQDGAAGWDGKGSDGKWVSPLESGYFIQVKVSMEDGRGTTADASDTAVEIHSLTFNKPEDAKPEELRVIMNDPNHAEEIAVTVKVKEKGGGGVVTEVPIDVDYSFSDPGEANTPQGDSYEYATGKFLGKAGDAGATYWADHLKSASESDDHYKLTCRATTIVAKGEDQGKAYINFKPSGVGGDDFQLEASVKHEDGTVLKAARSGVLTVWRRVLYDNVYEMEGEDHVSTIAKKTFIQPFFNDAFVQVEFGPVKRIPAEKSVKFIGLWKNDGDHQQSWDEIKQRQDAEIPSEEEENAPEDPDPEDPASVAAHNGIKRKAQAWVTRIDDARRASWTAWRDTEIGKDALVGIKYYHPKYSQADGEWFTGLTWPHWVRVTTFHGQYPNRVPDSLWTKVDNTVFLGLEMGNGVATISKETPALRVRRTIAHEVAHSTRPGQVDNAALKNRFHRASFGVDDHSPEGGLMNSESNHQIFSDRELDILRGRE